ncbi:MAG: acyltransferase family protein [Ignavibacteriae bacterium]|nr:acyltransferase family protein [Ignavibacteriota bacterium]
MIEQNNLSQRKYYLDWLRVIAFYILIFFHVGMIFVPWSFHIKNNITLEWFETWMAFSNQWRLPLLFMISGMVIYYSMGKRSANGIIKERAKRLLIPLIFGMLVIVPPQIYYERISNGVQFANYFDFWKTVFNFVPYPEGGSLSWHHLWYVLYIFVYSIIGLPLFLYLRSDKSFKLRKNVNEFFVKYSNSIYLIIFPLLFFYYTLGSIFPTTHALIDDWYNHSVSFTIFILGFCISSFSGLWETIVAKRKQSLIMASVPGLFLILFVWGPTFYIMNEETIVFEIFYGLLKWVFIISWLFTILGYSKFIFNKPSKLLTYTNESVYPLYILHQSIMIIFGYYIIHLDWNVYLKFWVIVLITFGGSFLFYELFIKRFNMMRLLFGMKSKKSKIKTASYKSAEDII